MYASRTWDAVHSPLSILVTISRAAQPSSAHPALHGRRCSPVARRKTWCCSASEELGDALSARAASAATASSRCARLSRAMSFEDVENGDGIAGAGVRCARGTGWADRGAGNASPINLLGTPRSRAIAGVEGVWFCGCEREPVWPFGSRAWQHGGAWQHGRPCQREHGRASRISWAAQRPWAARRLMCCIPCLPRD